ncbi:MAG: DNRLRE domain-containing protein [Candidatus Krumholzibacteria bacterium]|nr:DNRLRE domain-containing protein [Candidatus Krumholzibacteria bacterium]
MRTYVVLIAALVAVLGAASLQAKELVISPARVEAIVSPTDSRDSRVLVYFELPKELYDKKVVIDNAALVFEARVTDAEFGMVHVFPATREWQTEASIAWTSPQEKAGGDFTKRIAGKSVTLKAANSGKEISSNVTFIVMDWVSGRLTNNGLILVPSQEDLADSAARFAFDKGTLKLKIECTR